MHNQKAADEEWALLLWVIFESVLYETGLVDLIRQDGDCGWAIHFYILALKKGEERNKLKGEEIKACHTCVSY